MKSTAVLSLLLPFAIACGCPTSRTARVDTIYGSYNPEAADGRAGFAQLKTLVGSWKATRSDGKDVHAHYKEISGGSVLMETYVTPSGRETMTAYHPDGRHLMMTHYCAQGNQPRLQAIAVARDAISFKYFDASNVEDKQDLMVTLAFRFRDASTFERNETYRLATGGLETTTLVFQRVAALSQTEPTR